MVFVYRHCSWVTTDRPTSTANSSLMDIIDISVFENDENMDPFDITSSIPLTSLRKCARCKKERPLDQFAPDTKTRRRQLRPSPITTSTRLRQECLKCRESRKSLLQKRHAETRAAKEERLFVPRYVTWDRLLSRIETYVLSCQVG